MKFSIETWKKFTVALVLTVCTGLMANAQTFQSGGSYNTAANWNPASVPSGTGTNITIAASPTISAANTIGNVNISNNNIQITVNGSGTLTLGSSALFGAGTNKNLTISGNNAQIQIATGGKIEIWGNVTVANNLQLQVTGQFIVHGNLTMTNGAQIQASGGGDIIVGGNFTGGNNTQIQISGAGSTLQVTGALSIGNGSSSLQASGGGSITASSCSCTGCGGGTGCAGNVTLPVTLFNFKGTAGRTENTVSWSTASEKNFSYFDIERSTDGEHFDVLGSVAGHGNTVDRRDYSFTDIFPVVGSNYYRLRAVDFDGFEQVFNVIHVKYEGNRIMRVYPNPATTSDMNVDFNFNTNGAIAYTVYNLTGSVVGSYSGDRTLNREALLSSLPAGTYVLKAFGTDFVLTSRFILK